MGEVGGGGRRSGKVVHGLKEWGRVIHCPRGSGQGLGWSIAEGQFGGSGGQGVKHSYFSYFFLFFSLNSYFSYFLLFFSLNSYFPYFFQILRLSLGMGM